MSIQNNSRVGSNGPQIDQHGEHLQLQVGKQHYDLTTEEGKQALERDLRDGKLDGKAKDADFRGVTYDSQSNAVFAGDKTYWLDDPEQYEAFLRDAGDGKLDGYDGKAPKKEVRIGERTYDLSTEAGRQAFKEDWDTGDNGVETNDGFDYDPRTNKITAGGGERTYDLDDANERRLFHLDVRDNNLDGKRTDQSLREVWIGGGVYDLSSRYGREQLQADLDSGSLAVPGSKGYSYDAETNVVRIGDGQKTYDLDDPAQRAAFRSDLADGNLDGKATPRDLKHFNLGGETFDLSKPGGREKLAESLATGAHGVATGEGWTYDPEKNVVSLADSEQHYDLNNPEDLAAFRRDVADGDLDGFASGGSPYPQVPLYLREVKIGDKSYDLSTEKGARAFEKDIADGRLDGRAGKTGGEYKGVSYDPETRTVTAGDRVYYLDNPKDFHDFRRDAADGKLGGEARQPLFDRGPIRC